MDKELAPLVDKEYLPLVRQMSFDDVQMLGAISFIPGINILFFGSYLSLFLIHLLLLPFTWPLITIWVYFVCSGENVSLSGHIYNIIMLPQVFEFNLLKCHYAKDY